MEKLVKTLRQTYPHLQIVAGPIAQWSPATNTIVYRNEAGPAAIWTLLHELAHALLEHTTYQSDAHLLKKETEAWAKAIELASEYGEYIDGEHIQTCLDTYRDWLHKRSTCPECHTHGVQSSERLYTCLNCRSTWKVTSARFCRPYRLTKALTANQKPGPYDPGF